MKLSKTHITCIIDVRTFNVTRNNGYMLSIGQIWKNFIHELKRNEFQPPFDINMNWISIGVSPQRENERLGQWCAQWLNVQKLWSGMKMRHKLKQLL